MSSEVIIVSDPRDPSGHGMFSKIGQHSSEAHAILSKKDEILNGKAKQFKVVPISHQYVLLCLLDNPS